MRKVTVSDEDMEYLQGIMQKYDMSQSKAVHYLITGKMENGKVRKAKYFFPASLKIEENALRDFRLGKYDRLIIKHKDDRWIGTDTFKCLMSIMERGNYTFDKLLRTIVEQERRKKIHFVNGKMMFLYNRVRIEEFVEECKKNGIDPQDMIDARTRALKEYGKDMERLRKDATSYCSRKKMEDYLNVFLKWNPQYTVRVDGITAKVVPVTSKKRMENERKAKYAKRSDKQKEKRSVKEDINIEELFNPRTI